MMDTKNDTVHTDIVTIGEDILGVVAERIINPASPEIQKLIPIMINVMRRENGVGLAAPQIGISQQIAVIEADGVKLTLINPKITKRSKEMIVFPEGCLSVPEKELQVFRHQKISIEYIDENNKKNILHAHDFLAVVCQHEVDHLNGILITDRYKQQKNLRQTFNIPQKTYEQNS